MKKEFESPQNRWGKEGLTSDFHFRNEVNSSKIQPEQETRFGISLHKLETFRLQNCYNHKLDSEE